MKVRSLATVIATNTRPVREAQPVTCHACGRTFRGAGWFHRHSCAGHLGDTTPPGEAPLLPNRCCCGRRYATRAGLCKHRKTCGWHLIRRAMQLDAARTRGISK